jgi:hypothetical protein
VAGFQWPLAGNRYLEIRGTVRVNVQVWGQRFTFIDAMQDETIKNYL